MFRQAEVGQLDSAESHAVFKIIEKKVSELIFKDHIIVTVTTFVNSGHSLMKNNFQSKHTIVQEAGKADIGEFSLPWHNAGVIVRVFISRETLCSWDLKTGMKRDIRLLEYTEEEAVEAQFLHRIHAR